MVIMYCSGCGAAREDKSVMVAGAPHQIDGEDWGCGGRWEIDREGRLTAEDKARNILIRMGYDARDKSAGDVVELANLVNKTDFQWYHEEAHRTLIPERLTDPDVEMFATVMLASEAGEVLGIIQKERWQGRPRDDKRLLNEVGDLLWASTVLLGTRGYTLEDAARANSVKLRARYPEGFEVARSNNRHKDDL